MLLFLIFINDLPDEVVYNVKLFSDDTVLYKKINTSEDCVMLQKDLDKFLKWLPRISRRQHTKPWSDQAWAMLV